MRRSYIVSMEILALLFLYLLSQNPDFPQKVQPIMNELKNSEEMLRFMKDLSSLSELFCGVKKEPPAPKEPPPCEEKNSQSPTRPIANDYIEKCLRDYFKKG